MILNPEIDSYIRRLHPASDAVLAEMEAEAARRGIPIVGPVVGRLLAQLVMVSGSRRIFELGSAIGYSTIWLARAAGPGAEVHYTDSSEANAREARVWFERAGVAERVRIHVGEALQALASVNGEFDLIFNDVDKESYLEVLALAPTRLRCGGLLVSDNALWHGRVLAPADAPSHAVAEFNRRSFASEQLLTTLIPLRDGVLISMKR